MVLSSEFGAVFAIGEKINVSAARDFRDEQCDTEDGSKQSGHRIRSAIRSLRVETIQAELQLSL